MKDLNYDESSMSKTHKVTLQGLARIVFLSRQLLILMLLVTYTFTGYVTVVAVYCLHIND